MNPQSTWSMHCPISLAAPPSIAEKVNSSMVSFVLGYSGIASCTTGWSQAFGEVACSCMLSLVISFFSRAMVTFFLFSRTDHDLRSFEGSLPRLDRQPPSDSLHYQAYTTTYRLFTLPLQLSSACRLVHNALTGPEAKRRNYVDEEKLQQAWDILDKAWQDIDQTRTLGVPGTMLGPEEIERYIASWQIFMFECSKFSGPVFPC
jgi:hypothetical protein